MEKELNIGDIVAFDSGFYEVEGVNEGYVNLSREDGCDFSPEIEYVTLVCKKEDRKDL